MTQKEFFDRTEVICNDIFDTVEEKRKKLFDLHMLFFGHSKYLELAQKNLMSV